ncbi:unnamed protein product, partial [Iphiclides podalirius]
MQAIDIGLSQRRRIRGGGVVCETGSSGRCLPWSHVLAVRIGSFLIRDEPTTLGAIPARLGRISIAIPLPPPPPPPPPRLYITQRPKTSTCDVTTVLNNDAAPCCTSPQWTVSGRRKTQIGIGLLSSQSPKKLTDSPAEASACVIDDILQRVADETVFVPLIFASPEEEGSTVDGRFDRAMARDCTLSVYAAPSRQPRYADGSRCFH